MNLADMLSYADIQSLSAIAKHYNCECSTNSKHELIQAILNAVNRKDVVEQTIESLSETDLKFLNTFLFEQRELCTLEELIARVVQVRSSSIPAEPAAEETEIKPRQIVSKYKERGWLFNGVNAKTKYLFQFPKDLKDKFGDTLQRKFERGLAYTGDPAYYRDYHLLILDDVLVFLNYVNKEEIRLTSDGVPYKRQLQQMLEMMNVPEELPGKTAWRFGYGRKYKFYPERFSLIYDYCYYNEYILEQEDQLMLSDKGLSKVQRGEKDSLVDMYRFWLRLYKNPIYNLPAIVHWVNRLAHDWVTVQSLKKVLCPYIKKFYYDSPEDIFAYRILKMMQYLGLVRIGGNQASEEPVPEDAVVQMTDIGKKVIRGIYVHDDETIPLLE